MVIEMYVVFCLPSLIFVPQIICLNYAVV